jgi:hypothetical protein
MTELSQKNLQQQHTTFKDNQTTKQETGIPSTLETANTPVVDQKALQEILAGERLKMQEFFHEQMMNFHMDMVRQFEV